MNATAIDRAKPRPTRPPPDFTPARRRQRRLRAIAGATVVAAAIVSLVPYLQRGSSPAKRVYCGVTFLDVPDLGPAIVRGPVSYACATFELKGTFVASYPSTGDIALATWARRGSGYEATGVAPILDEGQSPTSAARWVPRRLQQALSGSGFVGSTNVDLSWAESRAKAFFRCTPNGCEAPAAP